MLEIELFPPVQHLVDNVNLSSTPQRIEELQCSKSGSEHIRVVEHEPILRNNTFRIHGTRLHHRPADPCTSTRSGGPRYSFTFAFSQRDTSVPGSSSRSATREDDPGT